MPTYTRSLIEGVIMVFLFLFLHLNPTKHTKTFREHVAEFDFASLFLIILSVICVLIEFNESSMSCKMLFLNHAPLFLLSF